MTAPRFLIVTPTFQSEDYLNACIHSIASQAGAFEVHHHVQDGGSSDGTADIVRAWQTALETTPEIFSCRIKLTFESVRDRGMYDALKRGFRRLGPRAGDIMAWLNSDDLFAPGAFSAVAGAITAFPQIALCGGPSGLIDARGRIMTLEPPRPVISSLLKAGLYEGRRMPFIMQEGTFWTQEVWRKCGGLDDRFRLAGDWDLWRRMAEHTEYVRLSVSTGFHRRRLGQLSQDMDAYYREVDRALEGDAAAVRDSTYSSYLAANAAAGTQPASGYDGPVATWDRETARWKLTRPAPRRLAPPRLVRAGFQSDPSRGYLVDGAGGFEPPDEASGLPLGTRWINEADARLVVQAKRAGRARVILVCRPASPDLSLRVLSGDETLYAGDLTLHTPDQDQRIEFDLWTHSGANELTLQTSFAHGEPDRRLLLIDVLIAEEAVATSPLRERSGAHSIDVAVLARNRPQALARTLGSIAAQTGVVGARVGVFNSASSVAVEAVADAFGVDELDVSTDLETHAARFVEQGGAPLSLVLEAGMEMAPGALARVAAEHSRDPAGGYTGPRLHPAPRGGRRLLLQADRSDPTFVADRNRPVRRLATPLFASSEPASPGRLTRMVWAYRADEAGAEALDRILRRMDVDLRTLSWSADTAFGPVADALGQSDADYILLSPLAAEAGPAVLKRKRSIKVTAELLEAARQAGIQPYLTVSSPWRLRRELGDIAMTGDARDLDPGLAPYVSAAAGSGLGGLATPAGVAASIRDLILPGKSGEAVLTSFDLDGVDPVILYRGAQARPAPDGGARMSQSGSIYLAIPPAAATRAIWLQATLGDNTRLGLRAGDQRREFEGEGDHLIDIQPSGLAGLRRIELTLERVDAKGMAPDLVIALEESERQGAGSTLGSATWAPRDGFGPEQPPASDLGIEAPHRWILGQHARLAVRNPGRGWRRLTLTFRTESEKQRVMVMREGRILTEAAVEAKSLSEPVEISALVEAPADWCDFDLVFQSELSHVKGSAILESASLKAVRAPSGGSKGRWAIVGGVDFQEPAAPQFGLEHPFRWCLAGCRLHVQPPRAGRTRVTVSYRSASPGQIVTASLGERTLGHSDAVSGELRQIETLTFEVDLPQQGADIALDADKLLRSGRKLAFIIEDVTIRAAD